MPVYNAAEVVERAIQSVIDQTHRNWELLIINDGSTDDSFDRIQNYRDSRVRWFSQDNKGAAAARNVGLSMMLGDFFCFLDADDVFPPDSLKLRLARFAAEEGLTFVDGKVLMMDSPLTKVRGSWSPKFGGPPFRDLVSLGGKSFFGLTWLVKRNPGKKYRMKEGLTHSEDLLFYLELAREGGLYGYVNEPILLYRDSVASAMKDLHGLELGYRTVYHIISQWNELEPSWLSNYEQRSKRIMFRSYLRKGIFWSALRILRSWP
jgi:glycosyltransferase involved in cell wall biosynthesis